MAFLATGFVDGGRTGGDMLRRLVFSATSGDAGVLQAADLKVTASGTSVLISAGTGVVPTLFAGAYAAQSYLVANDSAYSLAVPANTGGSPVTWEVVLRVTDPQYAGEPVPGDPATALYVVPELVAALPTTKPYLRLATIVLPAGASTVLDGMITDRRQVANPRRRRVLKSLAVAASETLSSTTLVVWPSTGTWSVAIPSWATEVAVVGIWGGVYNPAAQTNAQVQVRIGTGRADVLLTNPVQIDTDGTGNASRAPVICPGSVAIPATMRGQTVTVDLVAKRNSGSTSMKVDTVSAVSLDMDFTEGAV